MQITGMGNMSAAELLQMQLQKSNNNSVNNGMSSTQIDGVDISKPGEFMSKLQQLQEKDPEKFKEVLTQMAEEVQAKADEADGFEGEMLSKFASNLKTAAETGDLSDVMPKPPQPPQGNGQSGPTPGGMGGMMQNGAYGQQMFGPRPDGNGMQELMENLTSQLNEALAGLQ